MKLGTNNMKIKGFIILLFLIIPFVVQAQQEVEEAGLVVALSTDKGNVIRVLNTQNLDEFETILNGTKRFVVKRTNIVTGEESPVEIGSINLPRNLKEFRSFLNDTDYEEFKRLVSLSSDAEVQSFLNSKEKINQVAFFSEIKLDFLLAFGLGYLDKDIEKGKLYQYDVWREDLSGNQELWGTCVIYGKSGNKELDKVKMELDKITASDSAVVFSWNVVIPDFEELPFPELTHTEKPGLFSGKRKYTAETNYDDLLPFFNRYLLTDVSTKFAPYYKINNQKEWIQVEKQMAGIDSTSGKLVLSYTIDCLPNDVIESLIVPEDLGNNHGPKSEIAKGIAVHKGMVNFIYAVSARDSVNSIVLDWEKLPESPYYSGIEVAKSWGDEEKRVLAILPIGASSYVDTQIFPVGTLFTYYVRPLFININGLEQDVPAMVMHSCTTFSKPSVPYNLQVKTEGELVKITWEANEDEAFFSYHVFRGTHPERLELISPNIYSKSFSDSLDYLSSKSTYYYGVMAMSVTQDTSIISDYVSYVPEKKELFQSPPLILFEVTNGKAYLSWDDVRKNDYNIAGYLLQRKLGDNEDFKTIHDELLIANNYLDEEFKVGETFYYRVASVNINGDTAQFSLPTTAGGVLPDAEVIPVNNIQLSNLSNSVRISWPSVIIGNTLKFNVYRRLPYEVNFKLLNEKPLDAFEFEDKNVTKKQIYVYSVKAINGNGKESEFSNEQTIYKE